MAEEFDFESNGVSAYSERAEQSVIGSLMIEPDSIDKVDWLKASMFFSQPNQYLFLAIKQLVKAGKPVDIVTVAELLDAKGKLEAVGGIGYIGAIVQNTPSAANIARYAEIVREKFITRNFRKTLLDAQTSIGQGDDIGEVLNSHQNAITAILEGVSFEEPMHVSRILPDRVDRIEAIQEGKIKPAKTGFENFDEKIGGLTNGDMVVVAGRPSMGKTALAVQVAEQMQTPEQCALVFTLEMTAGQLVDRMVAGNGLLDGRNLFRENGMANEDWDRLVASIGKMQDKNIVIDDRANTVSAMTSKAKAVKRKHGLSVIVIDYLQLMSGDERTNNREQEIAGISRGIKRMAKELNVPVIALSQLSRKLEERQNKRPMMSDLRESGAIEQDADLVTFVYRDEYYEPNSAYAGLAEWIVAKNRNGSTGTVLLTFQKESTRFSDYTGAAPVMTTQSSQRRQYGNNFTMD